MLVEDTLLKNEGDLQPAGSRAAIKLHFPSSLHSLLQGFRALSCNICIPPMPCLASQTSGPPSSTQGQLPQEAHPAASPGRPSTSTSQIQPRSSNSAWIGEAVRGARLLARVQYQILLARVVGGVQGARTHPNGCSGR